MLGRYELVGTLGIGGMATVYLARVAGEAGFQRMYAIKVLHPHLAQEPGFITMLLDEARIAARLHHPNVVPIVDLGSEPGAYFVAMEYVEGCSLSALLKKRPDDRPTRVVVPVLLDMLAGLDAAHSLVDDDGRPMNLVHRDVSPQNVLVGVDGSARITDFGIARAESRLNTTRPGELKGKYAYMAPEQIRGAPVDRRSDVFSAGVMLWSILTGRKLFEDENDAATMQNILELDVPAPSTIGIRPPAAFDAVCARALARDPKRRFATAQEMEEALREVATACGGIASRREVATWVAEAFKDELASHRTAIRDAIAGRRSAIRAKSSFEIPSFTPASVADPMAPTPPDYEEISTESPRRGRKLVLLAGLPVACAMVAAIWLAMRSSSAAESHAPPSPAPAIVAAPAPPPSPPPALAQPPAPPPLTIIRPPPPVTFIRPPPPPAPPPHHSVAHLKRVAPTPAPAPPVAPPPAPPKPTVAWDKDSPVPPP